MTKKEIVFQEELDAFSNHLRELIDAPSRKAFDQALISLEKMRSAKDRPQALSEGSIENAMNYLNDNIKDNLDLILDIINDETQRELFSQVQNEVREDCLWLQSSFPFFSFRLE